MKRLLVPALALLLALPLAAQQEVKEPNRNARFGLPGPASTDREAYLIDRPQDVLSYNATTRTPNWVVGGRRRTNVSPAMPPIAAVLRTGESGRR